MKKIADQYLGKLDLKLPSKKKQMQMLEEQNRK